jgi:hypothetical protein
MASHRTTRRVRLFLAVLLAPALVPICLNITFEIVRAHAAAARGPALTPAGSFDLDIFLLDVAAIAYIGALLVMLPCAVILLDAPRPNFWATVAPTVVLAPLFALIVYGALNEHFSSALAGTTAVLSLPVVALSGLCFHMIGVWKPREKKEKTSLLLQDYLNPRKL